MLDQIRPSLYLWMMFFLTSEEPGIKVRVGACAVRAGRPGGRI